MSELTKGLIQRQDLDSYDGTLTTSRVSSTGGTLSGLKVGDSVDVLTVFGDGDTSNRTMATIVIATDALGSANIALSFAPGTWTIDDDLTIAANFTVVVPAGCVFDVSAGKTLTIAGVLFRQHATYSSGSGTVTVSGTDVLATISQAQDYAVDTGAADAYVIAPESAPSSYSAGQVFRFKAANTNTGASTINVNSIGLKDIRKFDGSTALVAGQIVAGQIHTIVYEGVNGYFHLMDGVSAFAQTLLDDATAAAARTTLDALQDVFTTRGDMVRAGASGVAERFAKGTEGQIIRYGVNDPAAADAITLGTPQATTSGTAFDFTSIPAWVKRITVQFTGVSLDGTDDILVQIGDSGGIEATGYVAGGSSFTTSGQTVTNETTGFLILVSAASSVVQGNLVLTLENASTFTWTAHGVLYENNTAAMRISAGRKSLSAALDRVRITRSGTDTFDAGAVNIQYE